MSHFDVRSSEREQMVDITRHVAEEIRSSGLREGVVVVFVTHTTAGLTINENADPSVTRDILHGLRSLVPLHADWHHAEGNSDAHIKASLMGSSVTVPVSEGRMALGTWQSLYLCEFDGPRLRRVVVQSQAG